MRIKQITTFYLYHKILGQKASQYETHRGAELALGDTTVKKMFFTFFFMNFSRTRNSVDRRLWTMLGH